MFQIAHGRGHNPRQLDASVPRSLDQLLHQSMDRKGYHRLGLWNDGFLHDLLILLPHLIDVEGTCDSKMDTFWNGF